MIIALISALLFYLNPLLLGHFLLSFHSKTKTLPAIYSYTTGLTTFSLLAFLAPSILNPTLLGLLTIFLLIYHLKSIKPLIKTILSRSTPYLLIFVLSLLVYSLWRSDVSYPLPLDWDFFHHQTLTNQLLSGRLSLLNSKLSDTFIFNGYLPFFHLANTWAQLIIPTDPLIYFYFAQFLHLFTALLATYTLLPSIAVLILSGLIFESYLAVPTLMLIPQTLTAIIFIFLLSDVLKSNRFTWLKAALSLPAIICLHFVTGTIATFALILALILKRLRHLNRFVYILFPLLLILPFIKEFPIDLSSINSGEAANFIISSKDKLHYLQIFSGFLLIPLFLLGISRILKSKLSRPKTILIIGLILLLPTLAPIPYAFKFLSLSRYLLLAVTAIGFQTLANRITSPWLKTTSYLLLTLTLIPIFLNSSNLIKKHHSYTATTNQMSLAELQAAQFLKQNYFRSDTLLVSDPATQQILEPLSGINTPGGAYMNQTNRQLLLKAYQHSNLNQAKNTLWQIKDSLSPKHTPQRLLLVTSGRYFAWSKTSQENQLNLSYNTWTYRPLSFSDQKYINLLSQNPNFTPIYSNSGLTIFQVLP